MIATASVWPRNTISCTYRYKNGSMQAVQLSLCCCLCCCFCSCCYCCCLGTRHFAICKLSEVLYSFTLISRWICSCCRNAQMHFVTFCRSMLVIWETLSNSMHRLTSFVLRVFHEARPYVYVDDGVLQRAIDWITSRQNQDGSFNEFGRIFDSEMRVSDRRKSFVFLLIRWNGMATWTFTEVWNDFC